MSDTKKLRIDVSNLKPKGLVNVPELMLDIFEVTELADVVKVYYKGFESYIKAMEDGSITFEDLQHLIGLGLIIPAGFTGSEMIIPEWKDATDTELNELVELSSGYLLGDLASIARSLLKAILYNGKAFFALKE